MKIPSTCLVLLVAGVYGVARGITLSTSDANPGTTEVLHPASLDSNGENFISPQSNRNGWVNPEDLTPMPQCIAQQDQSTWLRTMTKCTSKRCTRHFGVICTHHQWLTQLSCLSNEFSADVVKGYLPYCSRSVLAKAQLYLWIRNVAGRTWLVDVGDANELQNLSPASLTEGYAAVGVIYKAPSCLTESHSASSMEAFQHVMASCRFTSSTQHTGNAARPWEYHESLRSMIALDSETVGYDLTGRSIRYGDYFDKECFCRAFTMDPKKEPCSGPGTLDLTRERLWMYATCGPMSLPDNWMDTLKTTEFAYISIEDWRWPLCVTDMPKRLIELPGQCTTDACELDSSGYCRIVRAVDRSCFCHGISYDSCRGSCQIFEARIDYVHWLHNLCGEVQDWHGLPDNWRQLAALTRLEMIPWRWTIKQSNDSTLASVTRMGSNNALQTCPPTEWKLGSFALVNIATFVASFLSRRTDIHRTAPGCLWSLCPQSWVSRGILIVTLQLLATWLNVRLVQGTTGYEDIPVTELMLLWCSMPRLTWPTTLLACVQSFEGMYFSAAASTLFAESILQLLSSYYIFMTVNYGQEHNFYLNDMEKLEGSIPAQYMYTGARLWVWVIITLAILQFMGLMYQFCTLSEEEIAHRQIGKSRDIEGTSTTGSEGNYSDYSAYGTFLVERQNNPVSQRAILAPRAVTIQFAVTVISMLLLWIAQWLFWRGFIGLSLEEYVFMHILGIY